LLFDLAERFFAPPCSAQNDNLPGHVTVERFAPLAYFARPGGEAAAREVWRAALGLLAALGLESETPGSLAEVAPETRAAALEMIKTRTNSPETSSTGRLFDAAAVIAGLGIEASFEAEAAMRLEALCGDRAAAAEPYPFRITDGRPARVLLAPLVREMLADSRDASRLAARFHATLAAVIIKLAERARKERGAETVALSGGVFQNRVLSELARAGLEARGFRVLENRLVPPNDGGIALGQAWLAGRGM